jgi:hypothetical protein
MNRFVSLYIVVAIAGGSTEAVAQTRPPVHPLRAAVDVRIISDEADAALGVLNARLQGRTPAPAVWDRLFSSDGYQHLVEREGSMGRPLTDSGFRAFLMSDSALHLGPALAHVLPALEQVDVSGAAALALSYLPPGTPLRARLYLEIKHSTNSFVFTGRDSIRAIFLYVEPDQSPAQLKNTLAHELHHIGLNAACPDLPFAHVSAAQRMLLRYLGAFGEGQAMLAAAGSPSAHPHAADDDTVRARWDHDVANAALDVEELSRFFTSVLDGEVASADSVQSHASTYFGAQGPWYTVGWLMAATIERELGRDALIGSLCEPTRFIARYNDAVLKHACGAALPMWNAQLVSRFLALRQAAE